ncbi:MULTISPECIES: hypothetical protein [Bacteroidaceae]|jgi:hypothetical protein|nr:MULTISPECIES: hypothetical protein [Bacteroidaceae]
MMILGDFIKDWGGLILSSLGIIGGIWAYIRHDKKLKIQEIRLNEFQIKQFEKEENKEKMADMKCNVIRGNKGSAKIRFVNAGKSDALNVRIKILTPENKMKSILHDAEWGPYKVINPQLYREERLALCVGYPDTIDIQITWNDEYQDDRTVFLSVPL